jgi:MFS transporter, ACS family, solute carrier family 17 (sodium-dependent inorganic phosphate cotransporter), member 5
LTDCLFPNFFNFPNFYKDWLLTELYVFTGAQFGTVISMPLSGLLSEYGFSGGWPSIFYVFGCMGTVWCLAFLFLISEDPEQCSTIKENERKYIVNSLWGAAGSSVSNIALFLSFPN